MWHKSSYSPSSADCVEVREHESGAEVRDTKHREHGSLAFDTDQWVKLLASVTR
ncbi:DUF397 domain-containing protein [Nocardiopsis sp. CNR-923]|uniref:DUF397 domain-containing protein n=1 Tax=Nocardiopsis sp. CNR-923 TaxID=1904965 RepID=UPI000964ED4A|nr:DUF397 domain-containing protein [Nocardiopsis sp. CNR-923]OLT28782.1 DUF397 domain-containing protein [Nocardiopsis sp. CNR-923]